MAQALATARTYTIGAIVHDISDPYFAEVVRGLEDEARLAGYQVFVCSSDRDPGRELSYVQALISYRVDGLVFAGGGIEDRAYQRELAAVVEGFRGTGGAVVALAPNALRVPSITVDNYAGTRDIARYLLGLGHRRIGFVSGPPHLRTSRVRLAGYRAALREAGVRFDPDLVETGWFTTEGGAKAVASLLERCPDLTAVVAANDVMAFGVLHELAGRGLRVPQEVSVAGFDDVQMAAFLQVPLTTVHMPMYQVGREGARAVLDILAGRPVRSRRLPVQLVIRGSTAPPGRSR
ncbi:MAG TPA: substrate-binding domain-containing protein [Actinomycetota bacterium]|nr:substrate-binding domain-containing protein [Actinomycetota bacterium]